MVMADEQNPKDRDAQTQGDQSQRDRSDQQSGSKNRTEGEETDTLEDRNLSGSSTWATLPEQQSSSEDEDESTGSR
jgi:hypothetical protein